MQSITAAHEAMSNSRAKTGGSAACGAKDAAYQGVRGWS